MAKRPDHQDTAKTGASREDRLKSALKANMTRRKEQARQRAQGQGAETGGSKKPRAEKDA